MKAGGAKGAANVVPRAEALRTREVKINGAGSERNAVSVRTLCNDAGADVLRQWTKGGKAGRKQRA